MPQDLICDKSNIGYGNGLVPSGNKPLPNPILAKLYKCNFGQASECYWKIDTCIYSNKGCLISAFWQQWSNFQLTLHSLCSIIYVFPKKCISFQLWVHFQSWLDKRTSQISHVCLVNMPSGSLCFRLTLLPLKLDYSCRSWSIPWMLMPWLLVLPGHQQPCYWLCIINSYLPFTSKDFKYLCHVSVKKW